MSIECTVINHAGEKYHVHKPCFGFMSYIHIWGSHEDGDWEENEYPKSGFEPGELKELVYNCQPFAGCNFSGKEKKQVREIVLEAMKALPQFYGDVTYEEIEAGDYINFTFPLPDHHMDTTIMGAMMLRNAFSYTGCIQSILKLSKMGATPVEAFLIGNSFFYTKSFNGDYFYRSHSGDESIFHIRATVKDVQNIIAGNLGNNWQGKWGDTFRGYQRYGEMEDDQGRIGYAPNCPRTGSAYTVTTCMLIADPKEVKDSPTLNRIDGRQTLGLNANHFDGEYMENLLKLVKAV